MKRYVDVYKYEKWPGQFTARRDDGAIVNVAMVGYADPDGAVLDRFRDHGASDDWMVGEQPWTAEADAVLVGRVDYDDAPGA